MDKELKILYITSELRRLKREWMEIADPRMNWTGNMSFKNPTDQELYRLVEIQDKEKELKKDLREIIGWWKYIKYVISPSKFIKHYK